MKNLIFIFSMPRSGSTLLQRMLMTHPNIHSVSEPWILLPLAYMTKGMDGVHAPYDHTAAQDAIDDLIATLPREKDDYYEEIGRFAFSLYKKSCPEKDVYFLEKTPRYFLIIPFIEKVFPDAKFIFLFRNPLSVVSSIINTWGDGKIGNLYRSYIDLYRGPGCLAEGWRNLQQKSVRISYEMLVTQPEEIMHILSEYLGLTFDSVNLRNVTKDDLKGRMGDKKGTSQYKEISRAAIDKWKNTFNTKFRIWFAARYLKKIGPDILEESGYHLNELLDALKDIRDVRSIGIRDSLDFMRMKLYMFLTNDFTKKVMRKILIPGLLTWKLKNYKKGKIV